MRALFLDGLFITNDLSQNYNGRRTVDILYETVKKLPEQDKFDRILLLQTGCIENIPEGIKNIIIDDLSPPALLNTIYNETKNCDNSMIFNIGNPFYDTAYIHAMFERHIKFMADYTYSLGFCEGLTPVILRKEAIKEMQKLVEGEELVQTDYLFYSLSKDINSFDIETFLSPIDLRIARIKVGANNRGEELFTKRLYEVLGEQAAYEHIAEHIEKKPELLYTLPYMLTIELTNRQNIQSLYKPQYTEVTGDNEVFIDVDEVKRVIDDLARYSPACKVVFGGLGEPFLHPRLFELARIVQERGFELIIETDGTLLDESEAAQLGQLESDKLSMVVFMDALSEEVYQKVHPGADYSKMINSFKLLEKSGITYYRQIVRMLENEEEIESCIKNRDTHNLIVRKYSTYCGKQADKKVVDLAPLERIPCFHLRRELFLRSDGEFCLCQYSFESAIGKAVDKDLEEIGKTMEEKYRTHARGELLECCKVCDEYYIFNF